MTKIVQGMIITDKDVTKIGANKKSTRLNFASKYHKNRTALEGIVDKVRARAIHFGKFIQYTWDVNR